MPDDAYHYAYFYFIDAIAVTASRHVFAATISRCRFFYVEAAVSSAKWRVRQQREGGREEAGR